MTSIEILISGKVQGVGFRYYVQKKAIALGLKGYDTNTFSNEVKVGVEGEKSDINKLIDYCKIGSSRSIVESVDSQNVSYIGYVRFEIKH